jgi:hypothetical protein
LEGRDARGWVFKAHGGGIVAPRVVEDMTAVGGQDEFDT